jgi:hypothetical protein
LTLAAEFDILLAFPNWAFIAETLTFAITGFVAGFQPASV